MISLIICSADPPRYAAAEAMYRAALAGQSIEFIGIHDARSLAEAYNRGVAASRGEILIFSHDDVELLNHDLPQRLHKHLSRFDLVGVAGSTRLINGGWANAGPPHIFGQVAHQHPDGKIIADIYGAPRRAVGGIQALDGLFMAARRSVLDKISFDASRFDGFHLYDVDFTFQVYRAGLKIGVACDIHLLHQSAGNYDQTWQMYADRFCAKWRSCLPPIPPPPFQWSAVQVESRQHALEVMSPGHWNEE